MDINGNSFGYDYFKPSEYYSLSPEDLNPALKFNYRRDVNNYYSEPAIRRGRTQTRSYGKNHIDPNNTTLYILIICLIIVTVIQWFIIFFSGNSITINNIAASDKFIEPKKE